MKLAETEATDAARRRALTDREKLLLRTALVPAYLRRMRKLFEGAAGVKQRVVGLAFDRRERPVGVAFALPRHRRRDASG